MDYQNLFNEQYINQQHYKEIKSKQFSLEQQQEICKMLKALDDFMESASKIALQYQQQAFDACVSVICKRVYGNNK
jgi:Na+/phosphate symporter